MEKSKNLNLFSLFCLISIKVFCYRVVSLKRFVLFKNTKFSKKNEHIYTKEADKECGAYLAQTSLVSVQYKTNERKRRAVRLFYTNL